MNRKLTLIAFLALMFVTTNLLAQTMPDKIKQHFEKMVIGDWQDVTYFDGKEVAGRFSWRWSKSGKTAICDWIGDGYTTTQVAHWDPEAEAVVIHGTTDRGDFWVVRYDELTDSQWTGQGSGVWDGKKWESKTKMQWIDEGSHVYEDVTEGKPFVVKSKRVQKIDPQAAYKEFAGFMQGTWTREDDGFKRVHHYEWVMDKKFLRSNGAIDPRPWDGFIGIDVARNQVAWWGFFVDQSFGVIHLTEVEDGKWTFEGIDQSVDGPFDRVVIVEKLSDSKLRGIIRDSRDGDLLRPVIDETWERVKSSQ